MLAQTEEKIKTGETEKNGEKIPTLNMMDRKEETVKIAGQVKKEENPKQADICCKL